MGASIFIRGVRDLDGKFSTMYSVLRTCVDAGVSVPQEVSEYFASIEDAGYDIDSMKRKDMEQHMAETDIDFEGDIEYGNGALIDLSKIPSDVKKIRIFMEA